jgi:hypothetical protein
LAKYGPISYKGRRLIDVNFVTVMQYLCDSLRDHVNNQTNILDRMSRRKDIIKRCTGTIKGAPCHHIATCCPVHTGPEPHFGREIVKAGYQARDTIYNRFSTDLADTDKAIAGLSTMAILRSSKFVARHFDWIKLVPKQWLENERFKWLLMALGYDSIRINYVKKSCCIWALALVAPILARRRIGGRPSRAIGFAAIGGAAITQYILEDNVKTQYITSLVNRNDSISECVKSLRDEYMPRALTALGVFGCLYGITQIYRAYKEVSSEQELADTTMATHGNLAPTTADEIHSRDAEKCVWTPVSVRELDLDPKQRTCGFDGLYQNVQKNLVYASLLMSEGQNMMVDCLYIRSNVVLLPSHIFEEVGAEVKAIFYKANPDTLGGSFNTILSRSASYLIPGTDMCLVYTPNGGSYKNLVPYFARGTLPPMEFCMIWRDKQGELIEFVGKTDPQVVETTDMTGITRRFKGGIYKELSRVTFKGLCGAPMVVKGRFSCIVGFHLGGYTGTNRGCYGTIYQDEIDTGLNALAQIEGVLLSGLETTFCKVDMGKEILTPMEPHAKSPTRFVTGKSFNYHGQCLGMVSSHTDVKVMLTSEAVMDVCGVPNKWGPPKMKPEYFGWQNTLDAISNAADPISHDLLTHCVVDYKESLIALTLNEEWRDMKPLTDFETLNGCPGKKFITPIKLDTSVGYPLGGPKRPYVIEMEPQLDKPVNRMFNADMMNKIRQCEMLWASGQRANCVASACKKDEVLPMAKEKCRIFYASPLALVWGVRKFFLPIVRLLQMNPLLSECAVGVNSYSPEWDQLMKFATKFGSDRIFGGDYKKYDTSLPSQLIFASFRILMDIAKNCTYTSSDLISMGAIAGDVTYSFVAYNGDMISLISNMGISGHALTVIINSICGSLLQRAAFYTFNSRSLPFRDHVSLLTYGDDNIGSSSEFVKHDNVTVSNYLKTINMEYTMPDKSSTMVPFLDNSNIEFLKRKSVYHKALGCNVGALNEDSIFKSLHCHVHGKKSPITQREAAAINIGTALDEWFCHGPEVYEYRRVQMVEVAKRTELLHMVDNLFFSYDERVELWKQKYLHNDSNFEEVEIPEFEAQSGHEDLYSPIRPVETLNPRPAPPNRHKRGDAVSNLLPMVSKIDISGWLPSLPEYRAFDDDRLHCCTGKRVKESFNHMTPRKKHKGIGTNFSKQFKNKKHDNGGLVSPPETKDPPREASEMFVPEPPLRFETHSGMQQSDAMNTNAATADFHDVPNDYMEDMKPYTDSTRSSGDATDAPIQEFFKRPVLIDTFDWDINTTVRHQTNVWAQYLTNPRISNRINNYKLLRCSLHVKVTVNGNGFYYGRMIAAYNPSQSQDGFFRNATSLDLVSMSQMPHVFIDPTHSMGGELLCPFFYPYDYVDTLDVDWYQLGSLNFATLAHLQHANGSTDNLIVNVFAWAEDMELAIPTMHDVVGLSAQSGNEQAEAANNGIISTPATAVARTAGVLTKIPAIRPYAMAVEMASSSIASIARVFGFSRPSNLALTNIRPTVTSSLCLGNVPDNSQKLSLDQNQSVTIDPRVAGMNETDPLAIKYIAQHESYLATFPWTITDTKDDLLWNNRVDPRLWRQIDDTFAFTSTALVSMPFQYWSGSLRFRFQVCCSAFHKGRLAFVWDPSYVKPSGEVEYNTNYIQIIDISQTQDFTLEIPNGQQFGIIKSPKPGPYSASDMMGTDPITTQLQDNEVARDTCNGVLAVYVLNPLTAPAEDSPPVQINLFVSAGDDFEVHVPDDWFNRFTPLPRAQSGFEAQSGISPTAHQSVDYNAPENGAIIQLGYKSHKSDDFTKVYTGESILSLRMLLKRFSRWRTITMTLATAESARNVRIRHGYIPPFMGDYTPNVTAPDVTAGAVKWGYITPHLLHWVLPAYRGFRGSMRHKIVPRATDTSTTGGVDTSIYVTRYSLWNGAEFIEEDAGIGSGTSRSTIAYNATVRRDADDTNDTNVPSLAAGGAYFSSKVNPVAEIELPFYGQRRFANARHDNWAALDTYDLGGYEATIFGSFGVLDRLDFLTAVGEDFQPLFFVGLPNMTYLAEQPAPG